MPKQVGDRVGVMRKSDNSLHFFINGVNVGKQVKTLPRVLYGVVDIFGQAEEVTITGWYFSFFLVFLQGFQLLLNPYKPLAKLETSKISRYS